MVEKPNNAKKFTEKKLKQVEKVRIHCEKQQKAMTFFS